MAIKQKLKIKKGEKRRSQRVKIPLKFNYQFQVGRKAVQKVFAQDVSGGGIRVRLDEPVDVGQQLKAKLYFPNEAKPVTIQSKVVWCKKRKVKKKDVFDVGIKHIRVARENRERFVFLFCETMLNFFTGCLED